MSDFSPDDELNPPPSTARRPARRQSGSRPPRGARPNPAAVPAGPVDDGDDDSGPLERLQKVLAAAGLASRRHCEEYILDGRVTVDGKVVTTLGIKVDPHAQKVCVDGERIRVEKKQYFLVNKPPGIVSTNADPQGRPRVIDLLPPWKGRLFSVGRLDEGSEGLLLVTNDGDLAHRLAHPKFQVERVYRALVAGIPTEDVLRQLRQGLFFTEGKFRVRDVRKIKSSLQSTVLELVLTEGQNREIRRLLARVGHKVMKLKRIAFGPLRLGDLVSGGYRPLTSAELSQLRAFAAADPARRPASSRTPTRPGRPPRPGAPRSGAPRRPARKAPRSGGPRPPRRGRD